MRKIIAALQVSLDGFIEGEDVELDWVESWGDCFDLAPRIDACLLGARMYPAYEGYWTAILANPVAVLENTGRRPAPEEIEYADFAARTPHYVLSNSLDEVGWAHTTILHDLSQVRELKRSEGKAIHAVGGASLVSSLLKAGLLDELQLVVHPVLLGAGKPLFEPLPERHWLRANGVKQLPGGRVKLDYLCS
ncbi:Dihydrofolate reductase [Duganella sp. CF458]|uniref:dihydrofolate reductase family protein n=1 Tax=Duganella sp. CF458 TaxID=1884368 RepID=UPI0008E1B2F8|nr:dihydrofolate reductase family protein [Duganella sp. CF458]SFG25751.1 Dihydrofolate reductase [Duganella sp. CF458]